MKIKSSEKQLNFLTSLPQLRCLLNQLMPGWQPKGNQSQCRLYTAPRVNTQVRPDI
jgi:hypothetical protein